MRIRSVKQLTHRVVLCSQHDDVLPDGTVALTREHVVETWAWIEQKLTNTFSTQGYTVEHAESKRSHRAWIRYRPNLNISMYAWLYERRGISPPRWFKILRTGQTEDAGASPYYTFECQLLELGDTLQQPAISQPLPHGVRL